MSESTPWKGQASPVPGTATPKKNSNRNVTILGELLDEAFSTLFSLFLDQKSIFICWVLFLYFAIDKVFHNYENMRPAFENYWAWAFWLSSVVVAIVFIYNPSKRFSDLNPPDPPSPKPDPFKKLKKILRYLPLIGSIIIFIAPLLHGLYHCHKNESFQRYRSQVEQLGCDYHKLDFLKKMSRTDKHSKEQYYSELLGTFVGGNDALCETVQKSEIFGFWEWLKWLFLVKDYYGAFGVATVVWDNKTIETRATWIPIYSTWYKHDSTWTSRIRDNKEGRVICTYLKSTKQLLAILDKTPSEEGLNDGFFIASAYLESIQKGELITIQVQAHLSINQFEHSSTTLGPEWSSIKFNKPSKSSQIDKQPFSRSFICKEQLPSKKPQSSKERT